MTKYFEMLKKWSKKHVQFCPELPQNSGGKMVTAEMLSLKFKEIK